MIQHPTSSPHRRLSRPHTVLDFAWMSLLLAVLPLLLLLLLLLWLSFLMLLLLLLLRACIYFVRAVVYVRPIPSPPFPSLTAPFPSLPFRLIGRAAILCVGGTTAMLSTIGMAPSNAAEDVGSNYVTPNNPSCFVELRPLLTCVVEHAFAGVRSYSPVPDDGKERMKGTWAFGRSGQRR